jgi:hypothetical protein
MVCQAADCQVERHQVSVLVCDLFAASYVVGEVYGYGTEHIVVDVAEFTGCRGGHREGTSEEVSLVVVWRCGVRPDSWDSHDAHR